RILDDPHGRLGIADPLLRRFDVGGLTALLTASGLALELIQGDGVIADLVSSGVLEVHPGAVDQLAGLELSAAARPPLRDIASRLHALARRPG
ncbi:MAG: SAM-dependent methyltransferase, partial [Actinomycetes bacterium]